MCVLYKPICEVGSARSGTNFLANILSQHEDVAFWYIPKYIWRHGNAWWPNDCLTAKHARPRISRYIRRKFAQFVKEKGKKRFLENTQQNVLSLPFVNAVLPDCKIIHIIRDGRDVAASLRSKWTRTDAPIATAVRKRLPGVPLTDWPAYIPEFLKTVWYKYANKKMYSFGPKPNNWRDLNNKYDILEYTAITWRECVVAARSFGNTLPQDRYREVRFEELVSNPEKIITELLEFLELPFSETVIRYTQEKIDHTAKARWQNKLSQKELDLILTHAKDLLEELNML